METQASKVYNDGRDEDGIFDRIEELNGKEIMMTDTNVEIYEFEDTSLLICSNGWYSIGFHRVEEGDDYRWSEVRV